MSASAAARGATSAAQSCPFSACQTPCKQQPPWALRMASSAQPGTLTGAGLDHWERFQLKRCWQLYKKNTVPSNTMHRVHNLAVQSVPGSPCSTSPAAAGPPLPPPCPAVKPALCFSTAACIDPSLSLKAQSLLRTCFRESGNRFHTKRASGLRQSALSPELTYICSKDKPVELGKCAQVVVVQVSEDVRDCWPVLIWVCVHRLQAKQRLPLLCTLYKRLRTGSMHEGDFVDDLDKVNLLPAPAAQCMGVLKI